MQTDFKNKVALVTGATSGMGKAVAEAFARAGAAVVFAGRNAERGGALQNALQAEGAKVCFVPGDLSQMANNQHLVDEAVARFGKIDLVSCNAGILGLGSVTEVSEAVWEQTLATNLSAVFYLAKAAIPELQKQPGASFTINASIAAFKSFPNHPAYCASKAGVVALMKQMSLDYGPAIRVNAVCPGPVDTPLLWDSARAFPDPEKAVEAAAKATSLKRLGTPEDVANLTLFLASDAAAWMTGSAVTIDGGILNR
ncbi:SDR family NAD(P)-dependent oxidoreductase [Robiginitalea sp. M366]|uniref:SDR family NAD(P)-dependent oxidoreductase n=1 Tax=Robiginitalea aestuariiviva TaxID=3036903 RepID=UPI00240E06FE|nr:SDR family oxidoreductase [Robiginitalea aestuariiviva]MDG1572766.1 SDR family NAD(P)-dependent oxidoreductase [Robiginitalea aestuariiviva]